MDDHGEISVYEGDSRGEALAPGSTLYGGGISDSNFQQFVMYWHIGCNI